MLTASGSPLVSGLAPVAMDKLVRVKVLRAFLLGTKRQEVGDEPQVELRLARELASYNKVEILKDKPATVVEPEPVAETSADTKPAKGKRGA